MVSLQSFLNKCFVTMSQNGNFKINILELMSNAEKKRRASRGHLEHLEVNFFD